MRDYRILEGLFFNNEDRALLRDRIQNTPAGAGFAAALEKTLAEEDAKEFPRLRFDWYAYNPDIVHSTSVDNYQNFNGTVAPATTGFARRIYHRMLALELLDKTEYRDAIREDMLRLPKEYPLHLFVMCDLGLILYGFLTNFLTVLDAERHLFTEQEQFELDNFARGIAMDIIYEQEEWLRCDIGQGQHCNNHMVAHSQAALFAGLYYHREDWVKYALENPEGILVYLEDGMTDPGIGIEGSFSYNLMSLVLLMESAEWLRRAGHPLDLYHKKNSRGYDMKVFFEAAVNCVAPNGRVVPIGDNYANINYLYNMSVFFRACVAYGEELPCLKWLAQHSTADTIDLFRLMMDTDPAAEKPAVKSEWYSEFGTAILKTVEGPDFWDSDAKTLAVRTGDGYIHGNCDHMAMLLFSGDNYLIRDFEGKDTLSRHVFSGHITRTLNRSRLAHSAVMIDGGNTVHMKGKHLTCSWERGEGRQRIIMEDAERHLYPGVWMKRTLTLFHDRLQDVYEVECPDERDIDYIVHLGDLDHKPAFEKSPELLAKWFPAVYPSETLDWMRDIRELDANGCICAEHPGVKLTIRAAGGEKGLSFTLPEADDLAHAGSHSYLLRVHGKTARFEAEYLF